MEKTEKTNFMELIEDRLTVLGCAVSAVEKKSWDCDDCAAGVNSLDYVFSAVSGEIYDLLNFIEKNAGTFLVEVPAHYDTFRRLKDFSGVEFVPKGTEIKEHIEQ